MSHHSDDDTEDTSFSAYDSYLEHEAVRASDDRPMNVEKYAAQFMAKLNCDGFLVKNTTPGEYQHLERKLRNLFAHAVYEDRKDRIIKAR